MWGGAEQSVPRIRPAGPASSWWSPSTSITSRGWPSAPAAPSTWCRGSVRRGRRAAGGARRPRSRPGDGHRRRRRREPGAVDPSGLAGEQLVEHVDLDHVLQVATGAGGAEDLVAWIRPARPASTWWSRRPRSRPGDGHRRRRRRGPGAVDPSGLAGEQLVEPVDLDHVQGVAIGAGGAEHLVRWIRPARPASSWWSPSTSITSRGWPPAPAAPRT